MSGYKELERAEGKQGFSRLEEKLRSEILRSGLSYSEIERRCGVSAPVISRFVARQRGLTSGSFCKLLELLDIDFATYTPSGKLIPIEVRKELKGRRTGRLTQEHEANMERNFRLRNQSQNRRNR
jgi:transcriptional regulator with XRE-family HTH domain